MNLKAGKWKWNQLDLWEDQRASTKEKKQITSIRNKMGGGNTEDLWKLKE